MNRHLRTLGSGISIRTALQMSLETRQKKGGVDAGPEVSRSHARQSLEAPGRN